MGVCAARFFDAESIARTDLPTNKPRVPRWRGLTAAAALFYNAGLHAGL
jgi:hypothetical protein